MNRLKTMRKVKRLTQQQVADIVGVTQNAYCYWELEKVRVDVDAYKKLAQYYGVSTDFLMGMRFHLTIPVEKWPADVQADYKSATEDEKVYLEYKYGGPKFTDSLSTEEKAPRTEELKIALFGGDTTVTDDMWEKILAFAAFLKSQQENNE